MRLWKCCTQYANKFGKLSSGHRPGKGQFSFQSQKGNAKEYSNYCTIAPISHARKVMHKILQARFQQYTNHELPNVQVGFRKGRGNKIKLLKSIGSQKKQESSRKHLLLLYWLHQSFWLYGSQQIVDNSSKDGYTGPPVLPLEKSVCRSRSNS